MRMAASPATWGAATEAPSMSLGTLPGPAAHWETLVSACVLQVRSSVKTAALARVALFEYYCYADRRGQILRPLDVP